MGPSQGQNFGPILGAKMALLKLLFCQSVGRAQQKGSLMPIEANSPWEIVGVDLFTLDNKEYLRTIS
jgi:hypothetical protein